MSKQKIFVIFLSLLKEMEIPHRELATFRAARLVVENLSRKLGSTETSAKVLSDAIIPLFGIRWGVGVIRRVGAPLLRHILWQLRNSKLPDRDYNRVSELWKTGIANKATFPALWESWRSLIERFNLDDELPLGGRFVIVDTCIKQHWGDPSLLARVGANSFTAFVTRRNLDLAAFKLWKAAVLIFADASDGVVLALQGASGDAETFIKRVESIAIADNAVRNEVSDSMRRLKLPKSFSALGPAAKMAKLRQASVNKTNIRNFPRTAAKNHSLAGIRF